MRVTKKYLVFSLYKNIHNLQPKRPTAILVCQLDALMRVCRVSVCERQRQRECAALLLIRDLLCWLGFVPRVS